MAPPDDSDRTSETGRPFIGIKWECCNAYTRVHRNVSGSFYQARCPRCGKSVKIQVQAGGSDARFFRVR